MKLAKNQKLQEELMRQRKMDSRFLKGILIAVIAAAAVYIAGAVYYSSHFYADGTVFGIGMRNQSVEDLKTAVNQKVTEYTLSIETRDGEESISASDISLAYDDQGEIEQMMDDQNAFAWIFMAATASADHTIDMTLDEEQLSSVVSALSCMQADGMQAPTDAHLEYKDGSFSVVDETYGNYLEYGAVYPALRDSILSGMTSVSLDDLSCYTAPKVTADSAELQEECDAVNKLINVVITYDFSDRQITADSDEIAEWITFGDDFTYSLDEEKVSEFVYQMAYDTDTMGLSRTFTTHSGSQITLKGGDYGWCINRPKTTEQLIELVNAGESVTTEPVYRYSGVCRDTNDIGGNYVEISISEQMMWVYKDGSCVISTPVVTGNSARGYDTPSGGVWAVDARITDYTLKGQDYNTEVSYWLPFNGNVGIHDATWRSSFGGSIYKTSGSHGCVNTPLSAMKTVYANVQIGYPVVVY